jgi:Fe-S cluster assembly ATP-binding protein
VSSVNALTLDAVSIQVHDKLILEEISLKILKGQMVGIVGRNGSGKSSLAYALAGHPAYSILSGKALLFDADLVSLNPTERAHKGLFVSFQQIYPLENVTTLTFLYEAYKSLKDPTISYKEMELLVLSWLAVVNLDVQLLYRPLYSGFSGGQKKRIELLQLLLFTPAFALLDEIDAGMDAEGMRILISVLTSLRTKNKEFTLVVISHNPLFLQQLTLDALYCVKDKKIEVSPLPYNETASALTNSM